jgi:hypothetical protein
MLLAGSWPAAKWCAGNGRRPTLREVERVLDSDTGSRDRAAILAAGGGVFYLGDIFAEVSNLLDRVWPSVATLAKKLHHDGEATHDDVLAALGLTPATASHGLALIRSGSVPGTFVVFGPGAGR